MTIKQVILIILSILVFHSFSLAGLASEEAVFVYDGDTILLKGGEKVRYLGIDAPEIDRKGENHEFKALEARRLNFELVNGFQLKLEMDKKSRDHYRRLLSYVFLENGDMVNAIMVRKGLARVMLDKETRKYSAILIYSQRKAIEERRGVWSKPLNNEEESYIGNRKSFRFHRPNCPFSAKICRSDIVRFDSLYDAYWEGYSPCKFCRP